MGNDMLMENYRRRQFSKMCHRLTTNYDNAYGSLPTLKYNEYMGYHNRITKLMEWCQQFTTKTFTRMATCLTCNYVQFTSIQYTYWTNTVSLVMHRKSQATLLWYSEMFTLLLYAWSCWERICFSLPRWLCGIVLVAPPGSTSPDKILKQCWVSIWTD